MQAEVSLLAFAAQQPLQPLEADFAVLHRSQGWEVPQALPSSIEGSISQVQRHYQAAAAANANFDHVICSQPHHPDPLLFWGLSQLLPNAVDRVQRQERLRRLGLVLLQRFSNRPDLLLQLVAADGAYAVLKSLPSEALPASSYYTNTHCSLFHLQALWAKGRYSALHATYSHYALQRRSFPRSDFLLRTYTIFGRIERAANLFRVIHRRHHAELQASTISNMLFAELGMEQLDQVHVQQLAVDFRRLTSPAGESSQPHAKPPLLREKPLLAIVSADLRMHPVGRFWLPLARALQKQFQLVHIAFNPRDQDAVRDQLRDCSSGWHGFDTGEDPLPLLRELNPDLLLDLGGHTADNRPGLLNHRLAPVQATYLGFYGPTYASHCDWWILDQAIARRVSASYPASEPIWSLPGPSLCFDPQTHGLPGIDQLHYTEPDHPVYGSFNHTRKLTDACINRFAAVMAADSSATLLFRSHSFYDHAVRRWFLRQFVEAGVAAHQLQPIPYAPSAAESLLDYGRTHLHLDTYPVCGTTTTLDSLAMGVPVLTCPNHLYAGAISAALIEQAGFADWVVEDPNQLPAKASELTRTYRSAQARRALALAVRQSPVCDTEATPRMFADQLALMLRSARL